MRARWICDLGIKGGSRSEAILNANQHGFRSHLTQLLENYNKILNMVEIGNNVDVIYTSTLQKHSTRWTMVSYATK